MFKSLNYFLEPRLEDFHRPYEGEETSAIADTYSIQNLVSSIPENPRSRSTNYVVQRALLPKFFDK